MKTMLLASAVAFGLSTGAAFAATSPTGSTAMQAVGAQSTQQLATTGTAGSGFSSYATRSLPNPTGQTVYGRNGAISLWAPDFNGGGDN